MNANENNYATKSTAATENGIQTNSLPAVDLPITLQGVVIYFDEYKGFGYLKTNHKYFTAPIFFHFSDIVSQKLFKTAEKGMLAEFEIKQITQPLIRATNVRLK